MMFQNFILLTRQISTVAVSIDADGVGESPAGTGDNALAAMPFKACSARFNSSGFLRMLSWMPVKSGKYAYVSSIQSP